MLHNLHRQLTSLHYAHNFIQTRPFFQPIFTDKASNPKPIGHWWRSQLVYEAIFQFHLNQCRSFNTLNKTTNIPIHQNSPVSLPILLPSYIPQICPELCLNLYILYLFYPPFNSILTSTIVINIIKSSVYSPL